MIAGRWASLLFIVLSMSLVAACASSRLAAAPQSEPPATRTPSVAPQSEPPATPTPSAAPKPAAIKGAVGKKLKIPGVGSVIVRSVQALTSNRTEFLGVKVTIKAKADIGLGSGSFVLLDRSKRSIGPNMPKFRPALSLPVVVPAGSSTTGFVTFLVDDPNKYRLRLTLGAEHPDVLVDLTDAVRTARGTSATPRPQPAPTRKPAAQPTATRRPTATSKPPSSGWRKTASAYTDRAFSLYGETVPYNASELWGLACDVPGYTEQEISACNEAAQLNRGPVRSALKRHLAWMDSHPAARCFRDAYSADRKLAARWLDAFAGTINPSDITPAGRNKAVEYNEALWRTDGFLLKLPRYFDDCG